MFCPLGELVTEAGEPGRRRGFTPVPRQRAGFDRLACQTVGNFRNGEHEVRRRIVLIEVNEVLQHGEGLMFRGVAEADSRARPASAEAVCSLAIERCVGILAS